ncbi:hypothetical protein GCM10025865_05650 [Paraoerskovia sediminicola]|uniref:Addiction module component n=1 Tax=Paraoerskovia sediminicola TaxID=1138587 RepID=A0ABN6XCI5_9CELL|nr:hypothetical protein GCM10025865_05650 [Paraoerskovia sediminicola]
MPVLLLRRRAAGPDAAPSDTDLLARLDGDLSDDAVLAAVVADLRAHPVLGETRELAVRWAREAADELAPLPDGAVKETFAELATTLADRAA